MVAFNNGLYYYRDTNQELSDEISNKVAANILSELLFSYQFDCDEVITQAIYKGIKALSKGDA